MKDVSEQKATVPKLARKCGRLLWEWFRTWRKNNGYDRTQPTSDLLTLYEAIYPGDNYEEQKKEEQKEEQQKFGPGDKLLTYATGTFVCHEWSAYFTFVPSSNGPHRLAIGPHRLAIGPHGVGNSWSPNPNDGRRWKVWLTDVFLKGVPHNFRTTNYEGTFNNSTNEDEQEKGKIYLVT